MRALVLSAGGMFGAYQAGVWRALEDVGLPEIVVGASIGSVNAWLIAGGCPADELVRRWLNLQHAEHLRWRLPRSLSDGILENREIEREFRHMCTERPPLTELGIVASASFTMKPALLRGHALEWRHVAASCALPGIFPAQKIGSQWYSDGGLVDPLPLWAALEMGATRIVAVNLLKRRPFWIEAGAKALAWYAGYKPPAIPPHVQVVEIAPSERLGTPRQSIEWSRARAEHWLALGEADAQRNKHLVVECFGRQETWPSTASIG